MSDNILETFVDLTIYTCKLLGKCISRELGRNTHYFKLLFSKIGFKNKDDEYPKLISCLYDDYYTKYIFKLPVGLCLIEFEQKL